MKSSTQVVVTALGAVTFLQGTVGCDKDGGPAPVGTSSSVASTTPPPATPPPPPAPRAPFITIDERGGSIDGAPLTGEPPDWQTQAAKVLGDKPLVAGEAVVVNMTRNTKQASVQAIVAALKAAKATSIKVRTVTRDQTSGELELSLRPARVPECTVVAMIEHEGAVALWSKGGGNVQRFGRGMAGPDLSTSTEALQKRAAGCDSPFWYVGAADNITWGLVFDLALRARGSRDAGSSLRPSYTVLLTRAVVPGHAVKEE